MRVLAKDKNNDLYLDSTGNIAINTGLQACLQACETKVSTVMGEQILFVNNGIPNFQLIWNGSPNFAQAEIAIRNALLEVDNVIDVVNFDSFVIDNEFRYNATIKTNFGIGVVSNGL